MKDKSGNTEGDWDSFYKEKTDVDRWSTPRRLRFYEWATEHIRDHDCTFLDLGSGYGFGLQHACSDSDGWHPHGADFSGYAVENAVIPTIKLDLLNDPIPTGYEYLLCIQTLEHFDCPAAILERILVAQKRQVIITVPYREDITNHTQHVYTFDEGFFLQFGTPYFSYRYNRLKVVYGLTLLEELRLRVPNTLGLMKSSLRAKLGRILK